MVREGVVEKDVITVLGEISMSSSSMASKGGFNNDWDLSEQEEEAAEIVEYLRRCKTSLVGQSTGLSVPRSPVRFRQILKTSRTQIYI